VEEQASARAAFSRTSSTKPKNPASITREEAARQQEEQSAKEMLATETGSENQNHETRNLGGSGNRWTTEAAPYRRDTRRQNEFLTQREKQDAQNMKTELCSELIATV
jgi:hypothetical protein